MSKKNDVELVKIADNIITDKWQLFNILKNKNYNKKVIDKVVAKLIKLDNTDKHKSLIDTDICYCSINFKFKEYIIYYGLFPEKKWIVLYDIISYSDMVKETRNLIKSKYEKGVLK